MAFNANILDTDAPLRGLSAIMGGLTPVKTAEQVAQDRDEARNKKAIADFNETRAGEAQREAQRQALLQEAFARHNGDWEATERDVSALDPELGLKIRKGRFDAQQSMHQEFEERMKAELAGADRVAAFARMALADPEMYQQLRPLMLERMPEDARAALPEQFDAKVLATLPDVALSAKEAMEQSRKDHELILSGKWKEGLAGQLAQADDAEEWANIVESYKPFLPAGAAAMVPAWTPDAPAKIGRVLMGPDAVADNAEQQRHNLVTEGEMGRHHRVTEGQAASVGGGGGSASPLVDAVMANPGLFTGLTPSDKAKLIPALQKRGFKFDQMTGGDGKPSTGAEKTALGFFNRARQADEDLQRVEEEIAGMGLGGQLRLDAPYLLKSDTGKAYSTAQKAFTEARLRKESGAAIADSEYANDRAMYFAQPGDTKATLEQKRRARNAVLAGLGFQAGRALGEFYGDEAAAMVDEYRARAKGATPSKGAPVGPETTGGSGGGPVNKRFNPKTGRLETVR